MYALVYHRLGICSFSSYNHDTYQIVETIIIIPPVAKKLYKSNFVNSNKHQYSLSGN